MLTVSFGGTAEFLCRGLLVSWLWLDLTSGMRGPEEEKDNLSDGSPFLCSAQ